MKIFSDYFDVFPRIVPADQVSEIRITPRAAHAQLPPVENIEIIYHPVDGLNEAGNHSPEGEKNAVRSAEVRNGSLVLNIYFAGEQEHNLTLHIRKLPAREKSSEWLPRDEVNVHLNVYSLKPDLMALRPYRGDIHLHSVCSDGREAPEYVAARYREEGFDFIAVTDHLRYAPSLRAIEYWKNLKNGFRLFPGEEVHAPDNNIHIINFGGSFSVNDLAKSDPERYRNEVEEILRSFPAGFIPENENGFPVASSEWVFDRIREGGGLAMFCHPYWQTHKYEISTFLSDAVFKRRKFDIFEIIGGFYDDQWRSNNCQIARYYQEVAQGNGFPVAGVSDSHGTDCDQLAFRYYTVVLAKSSELPDLIDAMRNGKCAAVEVMYDKVPNVVADYRLVRYIAFLVENYFPAQTRLCSVEGALMQEILAGNPEAKTALDALGNRVEEYRRKSFGDGGK